MRILLVDDEPGILTPLSRYFRRQGLEVDTSSSRAEAGALLSQHRYDVILADLRLSTGSAAEGLEILALARERLPGVRRVLLTGYGSRPIEEEARAMGVDRVLAKPQTLSCLLALIEELASSEPPADPSKGDA